MTPVHAVSVAHAHVFTAAAAVHLLADGGDDDLGAGFIAFVVVLVMGILCYFLFKSMSRHLGKVPTSFDKPAPHAPPADSDES